MQRESLQAALTGIAAQEGDGIEVLVVNAKGGHHPALPTTCGRFALRLANQDGPALDRPRAANMGLDHAAGAALLFHDDDDLVDATHVARLRQALEANPSAVAAYSGVRCVDGQGRPSGSFDEAFDSERLWLANYLPIHAVLFDHDAVDAGVRFDESLPIYEDWDFWRALSLRGPFVHVPGCSATYRLVGTSGLSPHADQELTRQARERFYRKWAGRLSSDMLEQLMRRAELERAERAAIAAHAHASELALADAQQQAERDRSALEDALAALRQAEDERHSALAALQTSQDELDQAMTSKAALQERFEAERQTRGDSESALRAHRDHAASLASQLAAALDDYRRLEAGYLAIVSSWSWRITGVLRRVRGWRHRDVGRRLGARLARALPLSPEHKQHIKVRMATTHAGARVLSWLQPAPDDPARPLPEAPPVAFDKEAVRSQAEHELGEFLVSGGRITLPASDGAPVVSVIVVLFNQAGLSRWCLQALAESRGVTFETLIVDNASTDRVPHLLELVDGVHVLPQEENLGFLRAVNLAAAQARGRYLLLLNNDAVVEPETLARAARRLDRDSDVGAVGGPILLWDGRLQEAGSIVWRDGSCLGYGRGDAPGAPAYAFVRDVDYCSGALLLLRRELFETMGGFDEVFAPAYYEESDFCALLWESGHRVVYDPAVRVRHFEFASDSGSGQAIALQTRNRARFVGRHAAFLAERPLALPENILLARHRLGRGARRVLVIDDRVPLPWLGQGYPRAASIVWALVEGGHFVTHYPLQFPHEAAQDVAEALPETVEVMVGLGLGGLAGFMAARAGLYDLILVSRPHNMEVLRAMLAAHPEWRRGTRLIYDAEALFSLRDIAKAEVHGRPYSALECQRRVAHEMSLAQGSDAIVTVSEAEASHYRQAGYAKVHVLGHTLIPRPSNEPFDSRTGFLFVGAATADDTPNADSLVWFIGEVWPFLQQALGERARLDIIGACNAPSVLALASPQVCLRGKVTDLEPWFDAARVFIVPTRYAAGIAHKAHEAAARGLPMVLTPLIAHQLGWSGCATTGDTAEAFANACLRLHEQREAWSAARESALSAVTRDCDPQRFRAVLARVVSEGA